MTDLVKLARLFERGMSVADARDAASAISDEVVLRRIMIRALGVETGRRVAAIVGSGSASQDSVELTRLLNRRFGVSTTRSIVDEIAGSYHADAVHFDGDSFLNNDALVAVDSGLASWNFWLKREDTVSSRRLWMADAFNNANLQGYISGSGTGALAGSLNISLSDPTFATTLFWRSDPDMVPVGVWTHILFSVNTDLSAGNKICSVFINDVEQTPALLEDAGAAFTLTFNGIKQTMYGDENNNEYVGDASDCWIGPNVSLLSGSSISLENRRKFINADGKPVSPTNFPAGAIVFSGDATAFPTNQGTGGAFTLTGSLTNASTSPSD